MPSKTLVMSYNRRFFTFIKIAASFKSTEPAGLAFISAVSCLVSFPRDWSNLDLCPLGTSSSPSLMTAAAHTSDTRRQQRNKREPRQCSDGHAHKKRHPGVGATNTLR